ncbi:MAG: hypothetical protein DRG11_00280 [Epsilonproteobacteria bacterium]|nr:MAG: hypothetical protein DRG11_00280 [Campylobacterota bacterium]
MKKLFVLILLTTCVFGYELSFDRQFSKDVIKDEIRVQISISADSQTKQKLLDNMKEVLKFIKNDKTVKQTNYTQTISPKYEYGFFVKNRQFTGYQGRVSFLASSKDEKKIQNYIEKIIKFNTKELKISLYGLGWVASKKQQSKIKDQLIFDSIMWAKQHIEVLKNKTNSKCKISNISTKQFSNKFRESLEPNSSYSKKRYSDKNTLNDSIVMPSRQLQSIYLNMFYIFECK